MYREADFSTEPQASGIERRNVPERVVASRMAVACQVPNPAECPKHGSSGRAERTLKEGFLPLVLGGDPSIAVGSFSGVANFFRKKRVVGYIFFSLPVIDEDQAQDRIVFREK